MELGVVVGRCRRVGPGIRAGFWLNVALLLRIDTSQFCIAALRDFGEE